MNIYLELFGYLGTGLVLLSMMMTNLTRLRLLNLSGSIVSMIYAFACATWPVFVLNLCLTVINTAQLIRLKNMKEVTP